MTSTLSSLRNLSDCDLLAQVERAVALERQATAQLIALLMEVDSRKLYATQSCSSLFIYCVHVLHFSEHAAYLRIEAARAARRFPAILERLADGSLHLTAVSLLAPHLTIANHVEVLDAAHHKSKREVEQVVARLRPQPDVPAMVRKLPAPTPAVSPQAPVPVEAAPVVVEDRQADGVPGAPTVVAAPPQRPPEITPLAPERFKVQFTIGRDTYDKLCHVQNLLRHTIPTGDPAAIFDRALTLLLAELSKTKFSAAVRPRPIRKTRPGSRHIPAAVKREVWRRDGGQCAFRGELGRCSETGFLEFHHVVPYAKGGAATRENIELRCRMHNVYEAEQHVVRSAQPFLVRETRADYGMGPPTRSGPSVRQTSSLQHDRAAVIDIGSALRGARLFGASAVSGARFPSLTTCCKRRVVLVTGYVHHAKIPSTSYMAISATQNRRTANDRREREVSTKPVSL